MGPSLQDQPEKHRADSRPQLFLWRSNAGRRLCRRLQASTAQWKRWGGKGALPAPRSVRLPGSAGLPRSWPQRERAGRRGLSPPQGAAAPARAPLGGGGGGPGRPCSLAVARSLPGWRKRGSFVQRKLVVAVAAVSLGAASSVFYSVSRH